MKSSLRTHLNSLWTNRWLAFWLAVPLMLAALLAVPMTIIAVSNNSHGEFCAQSGWFFVHTMSDDCFLDLKMVVGRWFLWMFAIGILFSPVYAIVILLFLGRWFARLRRGRGGLPDGAARRATPSCEDASP